MIDLPLFPLRSVLCPGVALPLHIFEHRYRLMVGRCLERGEPFGVVLERDGHEVGPLAGRIADVGTTAIIRRAGRYPDGRLDILTVGERRFRLEALDSRSEPYLVGRVTMLDEPSGPDAVVAEQAERVGRRFLRYLELLQPASDDDGPEIEIEIEVEADDDEARTRTVCRAGSCARTCSERSLDRCTVRSRCSRRWTRPTSRPSSATSCS